MSRSRWLPLLGLAALPLLAAAPVGRAAAAAVRPAEAAAGSPPHGGAPHTTHARAPSPQAPALAGTFVWDSAASDDVEKAINDGTHHMSFITKPFARKRLRATNVPYRRVVIRTDSTAVSVQTDQRAPLVTPADGTPIQWTRPEDGEVLEVRSEWEDGALRESFKAGDGTRVNRYSLDPDGTTMHLHVTITSPRLPGPIQYTMAYRRAR